MAFPVDSRVVVVKNLESGMKLLAFGGLNGRAGMVRAALPAPTPCLILSQLESSFASLPPYSFSPFSSQIVPILVSQISNF